MTTWEQEYCRICGEKGTVLAHEIIPTHDLEAEECTSFQCENCGHEWEVTEAIILNSKPKGKQSGA